MNYRIILLAITYPAILLYALRGWVGKFSGRLAGDLGDGALTVWIAYWPYLKVRGSLAGVSLAPYLDGNLFQGFPGAYAFSDMMPGLLPFVALLDFLFSSPVLTVNLIHVGALLLLPYGIYMLAGTYLPVFSFRLVAGLLGFFVYYNFDMTLHLQMQFAFAIPWALYWQRRWLSDAGDFRSRYAVLALLLYAWLSLVSGHLFLFGVLAGLVVFLADSYALYRRKFLQERFSIFLRRFRNLGSLAALFLAIFVALAAVFFTVRAFQSVGQRYSLSRIKAESYYQSLRLPDFHVPARRLIPLKEAPRGVHERSAAVHPAGVFLFFCGFFAIFAGGDLRRRRYFWIKALCAAALFWTATIPDKGLRPLNYLAADVLFFLWPLTVFFYSLYRKKKRPGERRPAPSARTLSLRGVALLAAFFWITSFGPLPLLQNVEIPLIAPYNILYEFFPGFHRIRAAARVIALFWIFYGMIGAYGFLRLALLAKHSMKIPTPARGLLPFALVFLAVFEALPFRWFPRGDVGIRPELRALHEEYAQGRHKEPLLIVAAEEKTKPLEALSLFHSLKHGKRLVGGYSGIEPESYASLRLAVESYVQGKNVFSRREIEALLYYSKTGSVAAFRKNAGSSRAPLLRAAALSPAPDASLLCRNRPLGRWRFKKQIGRRMPLIMRFSARAPFCVNPYPRLNDRSLTLIWKSARRTYRDAFRASSPFYYHPNAPEFYYAAGSPKKPGEYLVALKEGERTIYRRKVLVK